MFQLKIILFIQKLKEYEFSLDEIKLVLEDKTTLKPLIALKKADIEKKLSNTPSSNLLWKKI